MGEALAIQPGAPVVTPGASGAAVRAATTRRGGPKGRRATGFFSIKDDLVAAGARYVDEAVVVDGNLITSRSPKDLPFFLPAIIEALARARAAV